MASNSAAVLANLQVQSADVEVLSMRSCVEEIFLGGDLHDFEFTRLQLITLLEGRIKL